MARSDLAIANIDQAELEVRNLMQQLTELLPEYDLHAASIGQMRDC